MLGLPTRVDLQTRANLKAHRKGSPQEALSVLPYPETFFFRSERVEARPYQLECLREADEALIAGRRRMLFEMATGTGKTLTIAMLKKRWFQAAVISRMLFLADRIELAKQAKETFDDYLKDGPSALLFGGERSLEGQIVVGTLDTIAGQLGSNGFGHAYFDLVVTDECHGSILQHPPCDFGPLRRRAYRPYRHAQPRRTALDQRTRAAAGGQYLYVFRLLGQCRRAGKADFFLHNLARHTGRLSGPL